MMTEEPCGCHAPGAEGIGHTVPPVPAAHEGHVANEWDRWIIGGFPAFQITCSCGYRTVLCDTESDAIDAIALHCRLWEQRP